MDEEMRPTFHQKIKIFANGASGAWHAGAGREDFGASARRRNISDIVLELKDLIVDYNPSAHLLRQVMSQPSGSSGARGWKKSPEIGSATTRYRRGPRKTLVVFRSLYAHNTVLFSIPLEQEILVLYSR